MSDDMATEVAALRNSQTVRFTEQGYAVRFTRPDVPTP